MMYQRMPSSFLRFAGIDEVEGVGFAEKAVRSRSARSIRVLRSWCEGDDTARPWPLWVRLGCRGRIRTGDLGVMSPARCLAAPPCDAMLRSGRERVLEGNGRLVGAACCRVVVGLEVEGPNRAAGLAVVLVGAVSVTLGSTITALSDCASAACARDPDEGDLLAREVASRSTLSRQYTDMLPRALVAAREAVGRIARAVGPDPRAAPWLSGVDRETRDARPSFRSGRARRRTCCAGGSP
jgi:hypothetical protein